MSDFDEFWKTRWKTSEIDQENEGNSKKMKKSAKWRQGAEKIVGGRPEGRDFN